MNLPAHLALSQMKINKSRSTWTLVGIALSTAIITAIGGFMASAYATVQAVRGNDPSYGTYRILVTGVGTVLAAVIIVLSIIVVSNAFRVSAEERIQQFGLLKSVGATKKQITTIVVWEGVMFSIIGIPIGLLVGIIVDYTGIRIANSLLAAFNTVNSKLVQVGFRFIVDWRVVLTAIALSFLTILVSAWLPARRAAAVPAIDAIRGTDETTQPSTRPRHAVPKTSLIQKVFGFEGKLAYASLKRNRRSFRASVISLTMSIVLVLIAQSIGSQVSAIADMMYPSVDAKVVGYFSSDIGIPDATGENGESVGGWMVGGEGVGQLRYIPLTTVLANQVTAKLRAYPDTSVFGVGSNYAMYSTTVPADMLTPKMAQILNADKSSLNEYDLGFALMTVDPEHYAQLCDRAGVPYGSNLLVNDFRARVNEVKSEFSPLVFSHQSLPLTYSGEPGEAGTLSGDLPLHGELKVGDVPNEILESIVSAWWAVIVPDVNMSLYKWYATPADKAGFIEYEQSVFADLLPQAESVHTDVKDVEAANQSVRDIARLVMTLVYGFVGMLCLVALTNLISTVSANVRSRSREFAVLQSVGMTTGGIKRMLNLESVMSSAKALMYGLPLGVLTSYLIYRFFVDLLEADYRIPWFAMLACVAGVFAITWITMRYAASRLKGRNLIEAIRAETGMA